MFLITKDEIAAGCTKVRYQPELDAPAYARTTPTKPRADPRRISPLRHADRHRRGLQGHLRPGNPGQYLRSRPHLRHQRRSVGRHGRPDDAHRAELPGGWNPARRRSPTARVRVPGVSRVGVKLTFDTPWNPGHDERDRRSRAGPLRRKHARNPEDHRQRRLAHPLHPFRHRRTRRSVCPSPKPGARESSTISTSPTSPASTTRRSRRMARRSMWTRCR